ncbi:MAG: hypothetical protein ROZ36_07975 [Thermincola sp.]|nr:hypothetical protein [Thermincola sp.]
MKYTENVYNHSAITGNIDYPMPDEPFVRAWEQYEAEAVKEGHFLP